MPERQPRLTVATDTRQINEWEEQGRDRELGQDRPMDCYSCECGDPACKAQIHLSRAEYEDVRASARLFAIAVNHENPEADRVVSENNRFAVVDRPFGPHYRIARATDPRR